MARYDTQHKHLTRRRIIDTAGRRLKNDGVTGSGVATLMGDAGLTNGAFYAHFSSKDDLVANVLLQQLEEQRRVLVALPPDPGALAAYVRSYLSPAHRDHPGEGCPSAALLDEIVRGDDNVRQAYTDGIVDFIDELTRRLGATGTGTATPTATGVRAARAHALATFAGMVGTLQMARVITDPTLSDALLEQGITTALNQLGLPT